MTALVRGVLQRGSATILIAVLVLLAGFYGATQLQQELLPNFSFPFLIVQTIDPGAAPQIVDQQISAPISAAAQQLNGVQQVSATSLQNLSLVTVQFAYGTDVNVVQQQLSARLRTVSLPTSLTGSAIEPVVSSLNINSAPILYISVTGTGGQSDTDLATWANAVASPALTKVNGVSTVEVVGNQTTLTAITLDPQALARNGLNATDVITTLKSVGITFPAGTVDVETQTVPVRVSATVPNADALGDIILVPGMSSSSSAQSGAPAAPASPAAAASGAPVRLRDVATIATVPQYPNGTNSTNGTQGVLLHIYKTQNGNTVKTADGVLAALHQLNHDHPDYHLTAVYDQAQPVRNAISGLYREGLLGALFAIVIIFLFLGNIRTTLVTAISIPTSIFAAMLLLWWQGISLNTLTLGGLAIAVGRVVDDAIVVLENIYRHIHTGEPIATAVQEGTREVTGAITTSTITTVGVFLPLAFVGGLAGQIFLPFALTVTFALLASLIVALTVIPVLARWFIRPVAATAITAPGSTPPHERETWIQRIYTPLLHWGLAHRWLTIGISLVLFLGTIGAAALTNLPTGFLPSSDTSSIQVTLTVPRGADTSVTQSAITGMERVFTTYRTQKRITLATITITGTSSFDQARQAVEGSNGTQSATALLTLPDSHTTTSVVHDLRRDLQAATPTDGAIQVVPASAFANGGLSYIVQGTDAASVRTASDRIVSALSTVKHITNLGSDVSSLTPQIVITPDPTRSPLANTTLIGSQLAAILQGQQAGSITFANGTTSPILVAVPGPRAATLDAYIAQLGQLPLGGGIKLADVATISRKDDATQLTRINGSLAATISATMTTDDTGPVLSQAAKQVAGVTLPKGVTVTQAGVGQNQGEAFSGLLTAMLVAIAIVYIVMVFAFGGLTEPFVILFGLPLAAIGGIGALIITHHQINLSSLIGFLMLIGIVVTNAIVLMDLAVRLRREGMELHAALLQAGRTRVRPILMTALATILALMPLALGWGGSEGTIIAADLAVVVIGGLLTNTVLTLVVIPVVYSLLDGLQGWLKRAGTRGAHPDSADGETITSLTASVE